MRESVSIRPVTPDDFRWIATLTNHYITTTAIHFGLTSVTDAELQAAWEKGRDRFPFLIAFCDGLGLVGYAKAGTWRERAAYDNTAEVGIYVDPGWHGKGIGRALYTALINDCRARGFHTLVGGLTLPNPASQRLHESVGFTHVGNFREAGRKFDAWHDVAFYQLML